MSPATLGPLLAAEAERLAVPLDARSAAALRDYLALLMRFNQRIRLTASSDPRVLVERHIADALVAAHLVGEFLADASRGSCTSRIADVGAGGGLVGLPLALLIPSVQLVLVESNARKCAFLRAAIFELGLTPAAKVLCARLEQLDLSLLDAVLSRATWPPVEWIERGLPLVREGGAVVVFATHPGGVPRCPGALMRCQQGYALADGTPRVIALYQRR